ncbi:MAG: hypothetical protein J6W84_03470 [Bacteroidales bacterium]|nr:hypothetical protein [Bacteroidales bacterium]
MSFSKKDIIDAIDTMVFIEGIAPELMAWTQFGGLVEREGVLILRKVPTPLAEAVWTICVRLFGDFETTPREGWIEDADGFYEFIEAITTTAREISDLM